MEKTHSKTIGYILWIFGFTGAHRFYFGKTISGVIWALTGGLFLVGWLVDVFLIPSMERQAKIRYQRGPADYSVGWILLTFLGFLGIHRMYLGKWFTGLLYMCTGGLLGIGWIYDFFTFNEQINEKNRLARLEEGGVVLLVERASSC